MEQLTPAQVNRGRLIEVAMTRKKVELKLTPSQFESLDRLMIQYLSFTPLMDINDKAVYFIVHSLWEKKIRPRHLDIKPTFKLNLDIAQADALVTMLYRVDIAEHLLYELNLRRTITAEINHQTA